MSEKFEKGDLIYIPAETPIWPLEKGRFASPLYPIIAIFTNYGSGGEYVVFIYNNMRCYTKTSFVHKTASFKHADRIAARKGKRICLSR